METLQIDTAVAIYDNHLQAENAVKKLLRVGFDMQKISIVSRDYATEEHVVGYLNAGDRARIFGRLGAFWGALVGILFGSAIVFIPVLGHVVILGPLAATLFEGLAGAALVGGTSALVGALTAIGVPRNSALRYEAALGADKFLLVLQSDQVEVARARALLKDTGLASFDHHEGQPDSPVPAAAT